VLVAPAWQRLPLTFKGLSRFAKLAEIVCTRIAPPRFASTLDRWEQKSDQRRNNRDHDKEFHQSKAAGTQSLRVLRNHWMNSWSAAWRACLNNWGATNEIAVKHDANATADLEDKLPVCHSIMRDRGVFVQ